MKKENPDYWNQLSKSTLRDDEVELFAEQLNWNILTKTANLKEETWIKHKDKVIAIGMIRNKSITAAVYNAKGEAVYWGNLADSGEINDAFLLAISPQFSTLRFSKKNDSAKMIQPTTWDQIANRYGDQLAIAPLSQKRALIRTQIVSQTSLSAASTEWSPYDWDIIGRYQRIDANFIKQYFLHLSTKKMKQYNKQAKLTDDEWVDVVSHISKHFVNQMKDGLKIDADYVKSKHVVNDEFERFISKRKKSV